ncbi:MAG: 30S ribosomal protein S17e, partial [Candidatus Altarchaeaceae archaeon]
MGRIKSSYMKRVGLELYKAHKEEFDTDFENNKKKIMEFADIPSKRLRNK